MEHLFSNPISFNFNAEEVRMGLGILNTKSTSTISVNSYLHLTISHFLRFAEAASEQVNLLIDKGVTSRDEPEQ